MDKKVERRFASPGYNMFMGNILKCQTYWDLLNTVKALHQWNSFLPGEQKKLQKLALLVEQRIQKKPSLATRSDMQIISQNN